MVDNDDQRKEQQQQSSELNKDVVNDDNEEVQKGGGDTIECHIIEDAAVTTSAATNVTISVKQEVESLDTDVLLSDVKDNNADVVVYDDDNNDDEMQKGGGGTIKNITVGAAATAATAATTAARNVARAAKQHAESFGSDVLSDVKDASNFVLPNNKHKDSNTISNPISNNQLHGNEPDHKPDQNPDHNPEHNNNQLPMDMFDKTASALLGAVFIYAIADIRRLVRQYRELIIGTNEMINEFMKLPIEDVNVMIIVLQNIPLLQEKMKPGEIDFYLSAIQRANKQIKKKAEMKLKATLELNNNIERQQQQQQQSDQEPVSTTATNNSTTTNNNTDRREQRRSIYDLQKPPPSMLTPRTLEVFDDENSLTELVYAITIKRDIKEILIAFRGSVTPRDWLMDGKMFLSNVPNPILASYDQDKLSIPQSKTIGLHSGFYEYLFGIKKKNDVTKYQQIVNQLKRLMDREPTIQNYLLMITGHSLGGALATIFSFFLAFEKGIFTDAGAIISCINFASPKSGNIQFAKAFQELELQKRLICLRVANHNDLITERPDRLTCWTFCLQDEIFRHVGIELMLYPERLETTEEQNQSTALFWKYCCRNQRAPKTHRIKYSRIRRSRLGQFNDDFLLSMYHTFQCTASVTCGCCINDYMNTHSCNEYLNRVETSTGVLQNIPMQHMFDAYHNIVSEESQEFIFQRRPNNSIKNNESNEEEVDAFSKRSKR